jgi:MYXO-CTERM domain-containing protein
MAAGLLAAVTASAGASAPAEGRPTAPEGASPSTPAAPTAPAGTSGACPRLDDGVTVVVDLTAFDGGTKVRCAPGSPSSGLAALTGAGFSYEFVPRIPGMVCRIDGLPNPCNGAPTDAHWSYHHAARGGSWTYSNRGAGNRVPPVGSVEGWAFGAGAAPSIPPPPPPPPPSSTTAVPSPPPPTAPPATAAPAPGPPPPAAPAPPPTAAPAAPAAPDGPAGGGQHGTAPPVEADVDADPDDDADEDADADAGATTTTRRPTTTRPATTTADPDEDLEGAMTIEIRPDDDGGPGPTGVVVGAGLIAGLGALAAHQTRRRRSAAAAAEGVGGA